jgi:hypothetical protein
MVEAERGRGGWEGIYRWPLSGGLELCSCSSRGWWGMACGHAWNEGFVRWDFATETTGVGWILDLRQIKIQLTAPWPSSPTNWELTRRGRNLTRTCSEFSLDPKSRAPAACSRACFPLFRRRFFDRPANTPSRCVPSVGGRSATVGSFRVDFYPARELLVLFHAQDIFCILIVIDALFLQRRAYTPQFSFFFWLYSSILKLCYSYVFPNNYEALL